MQREVISSEQLLSLIKQSISDYHSKKELSFKEINDLK